MKTLLTTLTILLFFGQFINGQCRMGTFDPVANETLYPISGPTKFEILSNGFKQVVLDEGFKTVQGIELRVFLSEDINYDAGVDFEVTTDPLPTDPAPNPEEYITGIKTYAFTDNVSIDDYNYVIVQCVSANMTWGVATLGTAQNDCSTLSTDTFTTDELAIFPNPVSEQLNVQLKSLESASFKIFNLNGQLVKSVSETATTNSKIDVSSLKSGLYLLEIVSANKSGFTNLLVQN